MKTVSEYIKLYANNFDTPLPPKVFRAIEKVVNEMCNRVEVNEIPANFIQKLAGKVEKRLSEFSAEDLKIDEGGESAFSVELGQSQYVNFEDNELHEKNYEILITSPYFKTQQIIVGFKFLSKDRNNYRSRLEVRFTKDTVQSINFRLH